jgi:two-component sensor histidine kinase
MYDPQNEMLVAEFNAEKVHLPLDKAVPCGLAINEALTNVYRHAVSKEKVTRLELGLSAGDGEVVVRIADNGPGLRKDFDKDTSKLGVKLLKNLIEMQLRGEAKFESRGGTILTMRFPSGRNHYRSRLGLLPESME